MKSLIVCFCGLALLLNNPGNVRAETVTFDFDSGVSPNFSTINTGGLWTIGTTGPNLQISKPADDGTYNPISEIRGGVFSNFTIVGDFTVTVDFSRTIFPLPLAAMASN